ncbi:MAG: hypothetical protein MJB57_17895, partial [Gemmatimonadetes bacterium]|nr:hypothetical protein [Gemmatimonadota bacterium]
MPTSTPRPARQGPLDVDSVAPEPGVELRGLTDRGFFDAEHYDLEIDLSEPETGHVTAVATIRGTLAAGATRLTLDFAGLVVRQVELDGRRVSFRRHGAALVVSAIARDRPRPIEVRVSYEGRPENGLFFETDADGMATAFADNWPNRARWWFPSNDHPADKA